MYKTNKRIKNNISSIHMDHLKSFILKREMQPHAAAGNMLFLLWQQMNETIRYNVQLSSNTILNKL